MPPLVTKTIRVREDQAIRLSLDYPDPNKGSKVGAIIRELLDIYWHSRNPGVDIYRLRQQSRK